MLPIDLKRLKPAERQLQRLLISAGLSLLAVQMAFAPALAMESWEHLDRKFKTQVLELNVGVKIRFRAGGWIQLTGQSPKLNYPVFGVTPDDRGFRVVSMGSAFPVQTTRPGRYYLTNRHVVANGEELAKECERFFAAMRLAAEKTANGKDVDTRFHELMSVVNLSMKKDLSAPERATYVATVDGIWSLYDSMLSLRADPGRIMFKKYSAQTPIEHETGYFLHKAGPITEPAITASIYKVAASEAEPDLAILSSAANGITPIELDPASPEEGEEIQVIGYPTASDQIDVDASKYYAPTFSTGRISRVTPRTLQVDAPITTGNSGGPVVSLRGKVLGVAARRAKTASGQELTNFGAAVTAESVRNFAPELFGATVNKN